MVCKMMKKGLLGAAVLAGTSYLVFGTSAPSYFRTAFHKARHAAHDAVPIQFEIDRAKEEIANLEPAILNNREELARAEVDVEQLDREVAAVRSNLDKEKGAMVIVPSSAVETMGLGGTLATASIAGARAPELPAAGN